jgi:arylsulfatase
MLPTLRAAAGDPNVREKLLKGVKVGDKPFKVYLNGYNLTDALAGKSASPRHEFLYSLDDGTLAALRHHQWKIVFAEKPDRGFAVRQTEPVPLAMPKLFNLRSEPFETADKEGMDYTRWFLEHPFVMAPAQQYVGKFLATFSESPPSQKPGSFSLDRALESLQQGGGS